MFFPVFYWNLSTAMLIFKIPGFDLFLKSHVVFSYVV